MDVRILYSTRANGPMTENPEFYPGKTAEEIKTDYTRRKDLIGVLHDFSGDKILIPREDEEFKFNYRVPLYDATDEVISIYEQNPNINLSDIEINCDIMLIRSKILSVIPNIAMAHSTSDDPVLIITTPRTISIAYCDGKKIDSGFPRMAIDAIKAKTNTPFTDMGVCFGPFAQPVSLAKSDGLPEYVKNDEVWSNCIIQTDPELIRIDFEHAIRKQIADDVGRLLIFSNINTITDSRFYSDCASIKDPSKKGKHLFGAYCKTAYRRR